MAKSSKGTSKKTMLSNAKAAANKSTINAVANDARKGGTKKKKKTTPNPKKVAEAYSTYNKKHHKQKETSKKPTKPKTSRAKLVESERNSQGKQAKAAKHAIGKHSKAKASKFTAGKKALVIIAAALVVALGISCVAFAADEQERSQYVPTNTTLDGQIEITGLTQEELRALIQNRIENRIATTIIVNAGESGHEIEMQEVGEIDIDATVEQAFSPYRNNPVVRAISRVAELVSGQTPPNNVALTCIVNEEALNKRIEDLGGAINREAKNATYAYDKGSHSLKVVDATQGVLMDGPATAARISEALANVTSDDPNRLNIEAVAQITEPQSRDVGQGIFVDIRDCRVLLYEGGQVVMSYPCTPGTSGYATPTGDFYLSYKDGAPSWYNPHSAWSVGMPEVIGPGPNNPLGVRALAVSCGNGIFLHGTTNTGGLGSPGSHGCVRLSNSNIINLYDRVSEGIPIIIR